MKAAYTRYGPPDAVKSLAIQNGSAQRPESLIGMFPNSAGLAEQVTENPVFPELAGRSASRRGCHAGITARRRPLSQRRRIDRHLGECIGEDNRPISLACEIVNHPMQRG